MSFLQAHANPHALEYGRMIWWWIAAIRMSDGDALLELCPCYEAGLGVPLDRDRAASCYGRLLASSFTTEASRDAAVAAAGSI